MLLEQPIALTIMQLAIPNATVMTVQILIGLVEVYFVSRTGVDGLAGVAPVFPLVSALSFATICAASICGRAGAFCRMRSNERPRHCGGAVHLEELMRRISR